MGKIRQHQEWFKRSPGDIKCLGIQVWQREQLQKFTNQGGRVDRSRRVSDPNGAQIISQVDMVSSLPSPGLLVGVVEAGS